MQDQNLQSMESAPNTQIQEGFIMKNYKNICLLILLCLFIFFFVMVFYFFISLVYEDENETSGQIQYQITQYEAKDNCILIQAECIECSTYYLKKNNYIAQTLNVTILFVSPVHINIIMKGIDFPYQYQIPHKLPFTDYKGPIQNASLSTMEYEVTTIYNPMRIVITRVQTGEAIFDTSSYDLIYSRFYMEVSTTLPSKFIYGLGERNDMFSLQNGTFSIWNRFPLFNDTNNETEINFSSNTFGSQPIYLMRETSGYYHMAYLRNFNAMDIVFNCSDTDINLQYRLIGGIFDLTFSLGDEYPENTVKLSNDFLGGYLIPPIWSFGLTHLIWNYSTIDDLKQLDQNYTDKELNLEVMWMDYEYTTNGNAFTLNTDSFPKDSLNELLNATKLIANIGPCVKIDSSSTGYTSGIEDKVFLNDVTGEIIKGKNRKVGPCNYPDFFNPNTDDYWTEMLTDLNSVFNFSGIWLDDNEIYDIGTKPSYPSNITSYDYYVNYSEIPYPTGSAPLDANTIDLNGLHYENIKEYDAHSIYGILQVYSTFSFLNQSDKSPFIYLMTRANSVGSSRFSGHFQDFIPFAWISLKQYLANLLNYNLFGAPFMGGVICNGVDSSNSSDYNYDLELCARWIQLATFSPLFLVKTQPSEENIFLGDDLLDVFQKTIKLRNSLIPYMYIVLLNSTGNSTLLRPLFFAFPNDTNIFTYSNISNNQFTVGRNIMITPILEKDAEDAYVYFPSSNWYDFLTCVQMLNSSQSGQFIQINNTISTTVPLFIRGGSIIERASPTTGILNLTNSNLILHIALEKNSSGYYVAEGKILGVSDLYNDTTMFQSCFVDGCLITVKAEASVKTTTTQTHYEIKLSFSGNTAESFNIYIASAEFYGLHSDKCVYFTLSSYQLKVPASFTMNVYE